MSKRGKDGGGIGPEETLVSNTICAKWANGTGHAPDEMPYVTAESASVRRLMPVECERLQALPDGWTDLGGTADSRRYAALGDAVTATVAEWIGRRIMEAA